LFSFSFISAARTCKTMLKQTQEVSAACLAGLSVDLIVGLAATRLPACLGRDSKAGEPSACIIGGTQAYSCVPDLEQPVIS